MKPNMDYGMRPVLPEEIADVCGTARRAVEITGGDEATALFYLNNVGLISQARPAKNHCLSEFGAALRALRDHQEETKRRAEREALAAEQRRLVSEAWAQKRTFAAVMRACGVGLVTAKRLVGEVQHG